MCAERVSLLTEPAKAHPQTGYFSSMAIGLRLEAPSGLYSVTFLMVRHWPEFSPPSCPEAGVKNCQVFYGVGRNLSCRAHVSPEK